VEDYISGLAWEGDDEGEDARDEREDEYGEDSEDEDRVDEFPPKVWKLSPGCRFSALVKKFCESLLEERVDETGRRVRPVLQDALNYGTTDAAINKDALLERLYATNLLRDQREYDQIVREYEFHGNVLRNKILSVTKSGCDDNLTDERCDGAPLGRLYVILPAIDDYKILTALRFSRREYVFGDMWKDRLYFLAPQGGSLFDDFFRTLNRARYMAQKDTPEYRKALAKRQARYGQKPEVKARRAVKMRERRAAKKHQDASGREVEAAE